MKDNIRRFFTIMICLGTFALYAGDDPCAATNLSTSNTDFLIFDNSGNSDSGVEAPPLGGYLGPDTWFSFIMTSFELTLLIQEGGMTDPAIAIYGDDCNDPIVYYNVTDNNCTGELSPQLLLDDLTPGEQYYIRVWPQNGSTNGNFGIFLGTNLPALLDFTTFADASIVGDCIELTQEQGSQHGCAWYQLEIDFSQPFTHEMLANFGDQNANGADGICLVYQSNGPNFCGSIGGGIGAEGMPNSAIFEFDTWQNGAPYFDPILDHTSFNVNGNMAHPSSIDGPITLGNIEDGVDHTITFNWNPTGNSYELFFDGNLVLSGSYDIINNCFGGNPLAYWGYTASTGGFNNNQVICPIVIVYTPATVAYEEIEICVGESYNGWTESGFYISEESGANGCIHQVHTRLTIATESIPYELEKYICAGDIFALEGDIFTEDGIYIIETFTAIGCDSTIILDLKVITSTIEILGLEDFNCTTDTIILSVDFDLNYTIADVDFFWTTPSGSSQSDTFIATEPGIYQVNTFINYEDVLCQVSAKIELEIDTITPIISDISDLFILCNSSLEDQILVAPEGQENLNFSWYFGNELVEIGDTLPVSIAGNYTLIATDTINGCTDTSMAQVVIDEDIPNIDLENDTLIINCKDTEQILSAIVDYQQPGSLAWYLDGDFLTDTQEPTVTETGTYTLKIIDVNGCIISDSVRLLIDTIAPTISVSDIILPCDIAEVTIDSVSFVSNITATWNGPESLSNLLNPTITTSGIYDVLVVNNINFCEARDTMVIDILGPTPEIQIQGEDILDCNNESAEISATTNQNNAILNWYNDEGNLLTSNSDLVVNTEGIYTIEASSQSGCITSDSISVTENFTYPTVTLISDTLDCDNLQATIDATIVNGTIESWDTADSSNPTTSTITTNVAGIYTINTLNVASGCTTTESIEVIDISNPPIYTFASNTISCSEPNTTLDLDILSAHQSVTWIFPDASTSNDISPQTSIDGFYNLHIEVEGSCDFDTIVAIEIDTISPSYQVNFGIIDCSTNNTFLNLSDVNNIESIIITSPTNVVFNNLENTVSEGGIYSISTIGPNGCITSSCIEISSLISAPEVTIEQDILVSCNEPNATITAISNNVNLGYTWTDDQTNPLGNTNTITVNSGGVYVLDIIDENGCDNIYNVIIEEQLEQPDINLVADNITCNNTTATIILESQSELTDIAWSDANGVVSTDDQLAVDQGGWYYVQGSNQYGCETDDSILVLENIDTPVLDLLSPDTTILLPNGFSDILIDEFSSGNIDYRWLPTEGLSCSDCLEPTITEYIHDSYQLIATNEYGCITTITIHVRKKKLTSVTIPNIFSPSSRDGNNDHFTLYGNENVVLINEMYVYDRWGNLVYSNNNFPPNDPYQGWDGSFKGESVVNGVYIYLFKVTTDESEVLTFTGDVTKI